MPALYIVATPIGNLEDISLRALRTLRAVKLIAAEDTRRTKRLLNAYDIQTPLTSYHEHNKTTKLDYILGFLEMADVALVSEAGIPGISDPGRELVVAANQRGIAVVVIPGPSVVTTALAISGLPLERFTYLGFLPRRAKARRNLLETIANEPGTLLILESPHRLLATLQDILVVLGDRRITICRELTKIHEEVFRERISQAIRHFTEPRGEFTLVIEGKIERETPQLTKDIEEQLRQIRLSGATAKETAVRIARETGLSKRAIYQAWLKLD